MIEEIKKEINLFNKGKAYDTAEDLVKVISDILDKYNNQSKAEEWFRLSNYKSAWDELKKYIDTTWYTEGGTDDEPIYFKETYVGNLIFEKTQELSDKYNLDNEATK